MQQSSGVRRRLLDTRIPGPTSIEAANITVVSNASELQAAVVSRARHIEIRGHLDLSELKLMTTYNASYPVAALGAIQGTNSIRVRCFRWDGTDAALTCGLHAVHAHIG